LFPSDTSDTSGYPFGYLLQLFLGESAFFFSTFIVSLKTKSLWSSFSGASVSKKLLLMLCLLKLMTNLGEEDAADSSGVEIHEGVSMD